MYTYRDVAILKEMRVAKLSQIEGAVVDSELPAEVMVLLSIRS
jgi:hypothetical protein